MSIFDDREKAFEAKFKLDHEYAFKIRVRRDKLIGLWVADLLGLKGDAAKAYALSVVDAEFDEPDHDPTRKLMRDIAAAGVTLDEATLGRQMDVLHEDAREQILREAQAG